MQRTDREGRGTRRLLLALAVAGAGVAVLAALVWRETRGRGAPDLAPSAGGVSLQGVAPAELVPVAGEAPPAASASAAEEGAHAEAAPSAETERIAAPLGPRGRVLEQGTAAPVAGVVIERKFAGSVDHRATTGPDGIFAFGPEVNENGTLRAVKQGWRFQPESLRPRHLGAGEELLFKGEHLITAPVRGRVVDEATGEPVARYRLWFGQPGFDESQLKTPSTFAARIDGERLRGVETASDEEGGFTTPAVLERGAVKVRLLEANQWRDLEHLVEAGEGAPYELSVPLGPTYFFDLDLPEGVSVWQLSVQLVDRASPVARDLARAVEAGWSTRPYSDPPASVSAHGLPRSAESPLRTDGDPAWARLAPLDPRMPPLPGPRGYALQVKDSNAFLSGLGYANSISGVEPGRIPIRLEPMAVLDGSATTSSGDRIHGALVTLRGGPADLSVACITGPAGSFWFVTPPGRYDLVVDSLRGTLRQVVELGEGETRELALVLPEVETMRVAGTIESAGEGLRFEPHLELRSTEDPALRFPADVDLLVSNHRSSGRFSFEHVPPGSYELLAPPCSGFALQPSRILVTGPTAELRLTCLDGGGVEMLQMVVLGAEGARIPSAQAWFWVDGGEPFGPDDAVFAPPGATVRWLATARGFAPREGVQRVGSGPQPALEVQLEPGPGVAILATDPWGGGVEGVEILVDGRAAGRTDARGVLALALRAEPLALDARKRGWVCESAQLQPELGAGFTRLARVE